jgi:hypothetical protein
MKFQESLCMRTGIKRDGIQYNWFKQGVGLSPSRENHNSHAGRPLFVVIRTNLEQYIEN